MNIAVLSQGLLSRIVEWIPQNEVEHLMFILLHNAILVGENHLCEFIGQILKTVSFQ